MPYTEWYGFAIDARDFERRFRAYTGGDPVRLAAVTARVEAMILFCIGRVADPVVRFLP